MVNRVFALSSVLLLLTAAWGAWVDYDREWKQYQRRYNTLALEKIPDQAVRRAFQPEKLAVRQIVVSQLRRVDRCVTCHVAYDNPAFSDQKEPLQRHSDILKSHPVEKFGCTICHGGQGMATTHRGAAHDELEFWEEPIWKGEYIQSACGRCHKETNVPGAPVLSAARILYKQEFSCDTCHKINGEGGSDGPDLTHIGSKPLRAFDFTHLEGKRSRVHWFVEHFKNPQAVIPNSEMANQEMTEEQAKAMTILMLSLTDADLPWEYIVREAHAGAQSTGAGPGSAATPGPGETRLFEDKHCLLCHTLRGRGGKVGPDLSQVASRRNADWLFQHFKNPGRMVPGSKMPDLHLSDAEANELTRYLLSLK